MPRYLPAARSDKPGALLADSAADPFLRCPFVAGRRREALQRLGADFCLVAAFLSDVSALCHLGTAAPSTPRLKGDSSLTV
jgi:hypothetical protein